MTPLLWCILILLLGLALIFLEIFIPSAGVLSVLAAVAVLTSVIMAYVYCGPGTGTLFLLGSVIVVPAAVGLALLWYPYTPIGRVLIGNSPTKEEVATRYHLSPDGQLLKGQIGKAATPLLPGGRVKIDSTSYDALSEEGPIERGDIVLVVRVEGKHLVVRKVSADHAQASRDAEQDDQLTTRGESAESPSLESLGIDPFDDPLG